MEQHTAAGRRNKGRYVLVVAGLAVAAATSLWPTFTTFAGNIKLEWLQLVTAQGNPDWALPDGVVFTPPIAPPFGRVSRLRLTPGTLVTLERLGGGSLRMDFKMPATEPATAWNKEGATRQLAGEFALRLDSPSEFTKLGSPLRIPFQGLLKYPEQSRFRSGETIPLIKGGTLLLIGQSIIGDELYELGKVELAVGDTVVPIELPGQSVGLFAV